MNGEYEAHIAAVVGTFPPLTPSQIDRLSVLLRGGALPKSPEPTETERRRQETAALKSDLAKAHAQLEDDLAGCHGCGLSKKVHTIQARYAGYHQWEPQTPDDLIKTVKRHKPRIAKLERKLAQLEDAE